MLRTCRGAVHGLPVYTWLLFLLVLLIFYSCYSAAVRTSFQTWFRQAPLHEHQHQHEHEQVSLDATQEHVAVIVASQKSDNTTWLPAAFPEWSHHIYVTDDPEAALTVPMNKGREAMVYLTYILDNWDSLPDVIIFHHANKYQWHNDNPLYDGQRVLSRLRIPYIEEQGYASLRCTWQLGCSTGIRPHVEASEKPAVHDTGTVDQRAGWYYKEAFEHLFPGEPVPEQIGAACCAQFAVTSWKIQQRPKSDYERYRQWLLETDLRDYISGRIIEYSWHIIFDKPAVFCPNAQQCFCSLDGLCDLTCEDDGACRSQFTLPAVSNMPDGWPEYGWDGQWQNTTDM